MRTHWDASKKVALDSITFRFINDPQAQVAALQSGDVDAMAGIGAAELYSKFQNDKRFAAVIGHTELKVVAGMHNGKKPFDDPRVRKALMMAIDRNLLVNAVYSGLGQPIGSHYTPNDPATSISPACIPTTRRRRRRCWPRPAIQTGSASHSSRRKWRTRRAPQKCCRRCSPKSA